MDAQHLSNQIIKMEPSEGFEPSTYPLPWDYSTPELRWHHIDVQEYIHYEYVPVKRYFLTLCPFLSRFCIPSGGVHPYHGCALPLSYGGE